jgi:single-strand DNA-binding protein
MNKYIALGNLTRDPSIKSTKNDKSVCNFSLAVNNINDVTYIEIETWGKIAENCNNYLKKGSKVLIEGRLSLNQWESKTGEKRSKIFCIADRVHFIKSTESENAVNQQTETKEKEYDEFSDVPF